MTQQRYDLELGPLTDKNFQVLKVILGPFEKSNICQIGYFSDFAVAGISCKSVGDTLHVEGLAVLAAYRRLGFGARLLKWAESRALADGLVKLHVLASSHEAKAFFISRGFQVIKEASEGGMLLSKELR